MIGFFLAWFCFAPVYQIATQQDLHSNKFNYRHYLLSQVTPKPCYLIFSKDYSISEQSSRRAESCRERHRSYLPTIRPMSLLRDISLRWLCRVISWEAWLLRFCLGCVFECSSAQTGEVSLGDEPTIGVCVDQSEVFVKIGVRICSVAVFLVHDTRLQFLILGTGVT